MPKRRIALAIIAVLAPSLAFGQSAVLQGGPWAPGHAPVYGGGTAQLTS